jgi:hypothetical protein
MHKEAGQHVVTYDDLVSGSYAFDEFPTKLNLVGALVERGHATEEEISRDATGTRVITHARVVELLEQFLGLKREFGTPSERALYKDMTLEDFVTRLLTCRPFIFLNSSDVYMKRNGMGGSGGFDTIATGNPQLPLEEYITYDEMLLSALLGVSCPTRFINSGSRDNRGRLGQENSFQPSGVIVGMVGARFERYSRMESIFCFVDPDSTSANAWAPYGPIPANDGNERWRLQRLWARFYGVEYFPTFEEAKQLPEFVKCGYSGGLFNTRLYKQRMRISIDTFLFEANRRAEEAGKKAYAVLTGLGLGMWMKTKLQTDLLIEAHAEALRELQLPHIGAVNFCWFPNAERPQAISIAHNQEINGIRVLFTKCNPAERLTGEFADMLLVMEFAWDSGSYVGNEYWGALFLFFFPALICFLLGGQLAASGDPAAACCCPIPQTMNPLVNPNVSGRTLTTYP